MSIPKSNYYLRIATVLASVAVLLIVLVLFSLDLLLDFRIVINSLDQPKTSEKFLPWSDSGNLVQTDNRCAAYSAMAIILSEKGQQLNPNTIYEKIPEKFPNGYIWPWGITRYLRANGISAKGHL